MGNVVLDRLEKLRAHFRDYCQCGVKLREERATNRRLRRMLDLLTQKCPSCLVPSEKMDERTKYEIVQCLAVHLLIGSEDEG